MYSWPLNLPFRIYPRKIRPNIKIALTKFLESSHLWNQCPAAFSELAIRFETYILSTSPWEKPSARSDKLIWVKKYN